MSVDLNALAPVTDLEQRMLDEAATSGSSRLSSCVRAAGLGLTVC